MLLLTACVEKPQGVAQYAMPITPLLQQEFQQAETTYQNGQLTTAALLYEKYIEQYPFNQLTNHAHYRLGEILTRTGQFQEGLIHFQKTYSRSFDRYLGPMAMYKAAVTEYRLENFQASNDILQKIPHQHLRS
ncbi:MAG: hypothetical protein Q7S00_05425, partial [bacterium]|nr:hypothetical protein [bacterium]